MKDLRKNHRDLDRGDILVCNEPGPLYGREVKIGHIGERWFFEGRIYRGHVEQPIFDYNFELAAFLEDWGFNHKGARA